MWKSYIIGWYRDCGIIPHTQDVDISIYEDEYDDEIKKWFLGNPIVHLRLTLGIKRKAYEFRMSGCSFTYDIFLMYKISKKKICNYYHQEKIYSVCFPPIEELCSAELFGYKFIIPCNYINIITLQYGDQWSVPDGKFKIFNMDYSNPEIRSLHEVPYMVRWYLLDGGIDVSKTLKGINKYYANYSGEMLTKLPTNDDEFL